MVLPRYEFSIVPAQILFKINVSLPEIKIFTRGDVENVDADIVNIEEID